MNTTVDLRKRNVLKTLRAMMESDSVTKVEIAVKTGLTLMTVNTIMNKLLLKEIITSCGVAASNNGRKATLYTINPVAYYIIGVNIGIDAVELAVSDLNLKIKETLTLETGNDYSPKALIDLILKSVMNIMKTSKIEAERVLGLGITVPGPVNEKNGVIYSFPNMKGWVDIPLKRMIEENLDIPVYIEKDNYASVLYLKNELGCTKINIVSLTIKGGIGTGILLDGSLYRGENGIAGEIGHVSVDHDGPRCNCGNKGCLEVYASDFAIVKEVKSRIKKGEPGSTLNTPDLDAMNIDKIIKAAMNGDMICRRVILKAAKYMGVAISNAIKFYDPGYFIINSRWIKEVDGVSDIISNIVKEKCTLIQRDKINLIFHDEEDIYLKGALMLVGDHVLENTVDNRIFC